MISITQKPGLLQSLQLSSAGSIRPTRSAGRYVLTARALGDVGQVSANLVASVAAGVPDFNPLLLIPALGGSLAMVAAAKFAAYSQVEVVRASMLSRHVKAGGAKVLQLGGSTKDIFYYPEGTVQVAVLGPEVNAGLWEQAGMSAGVPVRPIKAALQAGIEAQPGSSVDSIVAIDTISEIQDLPAFLKQVKRVLKPGGTFVFMQRIHGSLVAGLLRIGATPAVATSVADSISELIEWDFVQWDTASEALDPYAAGVAIKSLKESGNEDEYSADKAVFEQVMKRKGGKKKEANKGFK